MYGIGVLRANTDAVRAPVGRRLETQKLKVRLAGEMEKVYCRLSEFVIEFL